MATDQTRALLEMLYHISRDIATALDLRTVLQRLVFATIENVGGERGSIVVLDDNGRPVDATIIYGKTPHEHTTQQIRETVERGLAGWVVRNRKPALVPDTSKDERWLRRPDDALDQSGAKSAICVPLLARERLVGVLTLVHGVPNAFGPEHMELVQAIADQAGVAVLNARLYTESQRQARVMTALAEGAVVINTSLRLEEVLQRILNQTMQALQVETVAVALCDPANSELIFRAASGQNAGNILDRHIPIGEGVAGLVAREGKGVVIPSVSKDKRFSEIDRFGGIKTHAVAVAPIQAQGQVTGVLEAINPVSGAFDPDALLVMTGLGSLAGSMIQNAQLFEQLQVAHQRYRQLFEDSIDPILITDWEGRILEANRQAISLSRYTHEQLQAMTIDQLHDVGKGNLEPGYNALRDWDACTYDSELRQADGSSIPIQVVARRAQFEHMEALQWTLRDLTERQHLEELRQDLTAMIYHDLRSPLANIVSSLDVLPGMLSDEDKAAVQPVLTIARHSTARIQRMLSSLLDISRLNTGQPITTQQSTDLLVLVQEAVEDVRPGAEGRQQKLEVDLPNHLPPVSVDADMIRRVLINLLENAVKFTPSKGRIEIGVRAEGELLRVWVSDNGPGIDPSDQERIFTMFTRLKSRESTTGLGVGLAFCRLAVQGHGGRIWVESQPGTGALFQFTLPLSETGG